MGKALLIMVTGVFLAMGIYQMAFQNRMISSDINVAERAWRTAATTNANSAIEAVAQKIKLNPMWGQDGVSSTEIFEEGVATVTISRAGDLIRLNSVSTVETQSVNIQASYRWISGTFFPEPNGAMGIYSSNLSFNIAGSAFSISGHDYLVDGTLNPSGQSMPGIVVTDVVNLAVILNSLNSSQQSNVTGSGSSPSMELVPPIAGGIDPMIQLLASRADVVYTDEYIAQGEGSLGTRQNPQIVVVEGLLKVSNATGVGIIIIKEGGELDIRGNLDHYEGIIIVQGLARLVRGNIHVYGSLIFGGDDPELEIDIDLRGNVHIRYSSEVLDFVQAKLSTRFDGQMQLLGVYQ